MENTTSGNNNSLFKERIKEDFLSQIKESTRQSYERIFKITATYEEAIGKDLNEFSLEEIEAILHGFKANNRNTIESYGRIISSYLNWCVDNGIIKENVMSAFKPESFDKYILDSEFYLSEKMLRRLEDRCENYQDAVILRLLFVGISGKQLSEIRNIKKGDINFDDGQIKVINTLKEDKNGNPEKFTDRFLNIDEYTMSLITGAIKEKKYVKRNGFMEERDNIRNYTDLVDNNYVIRSSITKTDNWDYPVDRFVIYRRVQMLSDTLGVELTTKFIQRSGMIYLAKQLSEGAEDLSLDDLKIIANRFNVKSHHNLKGFLTMENIKKTYENNN